MKKLLFILALILSLTGSLSLYAQDTSKSSFGMNFTGFIRADMIFDTRQVETLREGAISFYPKPELLDKNGNDLNSKPNFNLLALHSRLTTNLKGPDFFSAKTTGVIEGEYFGGFDQDINGFRLRHAYIKLDWGSTNLLFGQFWHPMFVTDVIPSLNFAAPIIPYSRNPQVRLTHSFNEFSIIAALLSQRDMRSLGPDGMSSNYLRNSAIPNLDFTFMWKSGMNVIGAGFDFKVLTPRIIDIEGLQTSESLPATAFHGFIKLNLSPVTLKIQGVYGQNLTDLSMLGGYAVQSDDPKKYTNSKVFSVWDEISIGKEIQFNLFTGYIKNLGTDNNIQTDLAKYYTRGANIDNIFKIAPNVAVTSGKVKFVGEIEYASAAFGTVDVKDKALVKNTKSANNIRFSIVAFYLF